MACASCGGGKTFTPNRQIFIPPRIEQSTNRIVTTPQMGNGSGSGFVNRTNPNQPIPTKRTVV